MSKLISLICIISAAIITPNTSAADIPIETYVTGGVSITLNGDWDTNVTQQTISPIPLQSADQPSTWTIDTNRSSYISFADDSSTDGFYITIQFTDFIYSGSSETQADIPASNYKITANFTNQTPQAPSVGHDDTDKTLSILPESCGTTGSEDFNFHNDFSDYTKNYALTASTNEQTILTATNNCLALGHIRFDKTELLIPQNSEEGSYTSSITLTIYDGSV